MASPTPLVDEMTRNKAYIRVKRPEIVEDILEKLLSGGKDELQFIVDFDHTLTRAHKNGQKVDCSWGVMENSTLLPSDYTAKCHAIKDKYVPIEHDPNMEVSEKIPYMVEWYLSANKLLQTCGVTRDMFPKMVKASSVEFRDDTDKMLNRLAQSNVPVLILSAGLGDLVKEILVHFGLLLSNIEIVSNFLAFNEEGRVTGIDGEMIHVYNKNENAVHDSPYFKTLEGRHNIVLLGDSVGDLQMANGVDNPNAVLKIGFLNQTDDDKRLEKYMNLYDVVLVDDQTMDVPNFILDKLLKQ